MQKSRQTGRLGLSPEEKMLLGITVAALCIGGLVMWWDRPEDSLDQLLTPAERVEFAKAMDQLPRPLLEDDLYREAAVDECLGKMPLPKEASTIRWTADEWRRCLDPPSWDMKLPASPQDAIQ